MQYISSERHRSHCSCCCLFTTLQFTTSYCIAGEGRSYHCFISTIIAIDIIATIAIVAFSVLLDFNYCCVVAIILTIIIICIITTSTVATIINIQ